MWGEAAGLRCRWSATGADPEGPAYRDLLWLCVSCSRVVYVQTLRSRVLMRRSRMRSCFARAECSRPTPVRGRDRLNDCIFNQTLEQTAISRPPALPPRSAIGKPCCRSAFSGGALRARLRGSRPGTLHRTRGTCAIHNQRMVSNRAGGRHHGRPRHGVGLSAPGRLVLVDGEEDRVVRVDRESGAANDARVVL